jgi:hypothetical protein
MLLNGCEKLNRYEIALGKKPKETPVSLLPTEEKHYHKNSEVREEFYESFTASEWRKYMNRREQYGR